MKIKTADLEVVAGFTKQFPEENLKEIALAGRSNVGKSSFLNSMFSRKNLAKTSSKPGKTRTINFYRVNDAFRLVDLPGYGYAKASKKEMDKWADLINSYLYEREALEEVFLIVDSRHEPTREDKEMYAWIREYFTGFVIASKLDKLGKSKKDKVKKDISKSLDTPKDLIFPYSAKDHSGKEEILDLMDEILEK